MRALASQMERGICMTDTDYTIPNLRVMVHLSLPLSLSPCIFLSNLVALGQTDGVRRDKESDKSGEEEVAAFRPPMYGMKSLRETPFSSCCFHVEFLHLVLTLRW